MGYKCDYAQQAFAAMLEYSRVPSEDETRVPTVASTTNSLVLEWTVSHGPNNGVTIGPIDRGVVTHRPPSCACLEIQVEHRGGTPSSSLLRLRVS